MSFYVNMFVPPKSGTDCYLWKINRHGEIVVELLAENAPVCDSSRGMVVIAKDLIDLRDSLCGMLSKRPDKVGDTLTVSWKLRPWQFGVRSLPDLAKRLNSKGSNKAKVIWNAVPDSLLPNGIGWDKEAKEYVVLEGEPK